MSDAFGEEVVGRAARVYAYNIMVGTPLRRLGSGQLRAIEDLPLIQEMARVGLGELADSDGGEDEELERAQVRQGLRGLMRRRRFRGCKVAAVGGPLARNLGLLGRLLELSRAERAALRFLVVMHLSRSLGEVADALGDLNLTASAAVVGAASNQPQDAMRAALRPGGRLVDSGIVALRHLGGAHTMSYRFELKEGLTDLLLTAGLRREEVLPRFLETAAPSTLSVEDYDHVAGALRVTRELLAAALRDRIPGINILVHGPTGTGKTEFARLVTGMVGAPLYVAGRADEEGESANARERLGSLLLAQRLLPAGKGIVMLDELEDLFEWDRVPFVGVQGKARMSKQWFNDLLERNRVPTLWITNETAGIDRAFLRRFSYAVELRAHGPRQRARVLARHLGDASRLSPHDVAAIAERFEANPAQLRTAVHTARACAPDGVPDRAMVESVLAPMERLLTGQDPVRRPVFEAARYRIDALCADSDLEAIAERLSGWQPDGAAGLTLCLYGPPGTGKSEFARYLAHRMGRRVTYRRVSDILSCWVGESERRLAEAFREAAEEDSLLLFDETDSFLRDRNQARARWEVTETNEFLQQLESFTGVCAVTTNLWDELDAAALRRFVFKVEFRWLGLEQALVLFETTFAGMVAGRIDRSRIRAGLAGIGNLAPGDFAAVRRRRRALGETVTAERLVADLADECRVKSRHVRPIGFGARDLAD